MRLVDAMGLSLAAGASAASIRGAPGPKPLRVKAKLENAIAASGAPVP
jgi:hypothetical protein